MWEKLIKMTFSKLMDVKRAKGGKMACFLNVLYAWKARTRRGELISYCYQWSVAAKPERLERTELGSLFHLLPDLMLHTNRIFRSQKILLLFLSKLFYFGRRLICLNWVLGIKGVNRWVSSSFNSCSASSNQSANSKHTVTSFWYLINKINKCYMNVKSQL